jgi:hypothetical protein
LFFEKVLDVILDDESRVIATRALVFRQTRWFARGVRDSRRMVSVSFRSQIIDENARR